MIKKILLIKLFSLLVMPLIFGQTITSSKEAVEKELLLSQKEDNYSLTRRWITPNSDSTFYRFDTIRFYNQENYKVSAHGCHYLNWRFLSRNQLEQNESFICNEPPEESIHLNGENIYRVKLEEKGQVLYLLTYHRGKLTDRFRIVDMRKVEFDESGAKCTRLTLVRVRSKK